MVGTSDTLNANGTHKQRDNANLLAGRSRDAQRHGHMTPFVHYLEFILDGNFQFFMLQYHRINSSIGIKEP